MKFIKPSLYSLLFLVTILSCKKATAPDDSSVKSVVDNVVTRLYEKLPSDQLDTISESYIRKFLTEEEKEVLATKFWMFETNVPVTVSLMRDTAQQIIPFWIQNAGFKKTGMFVKNEEQTYEVWQKNFDAGHVGLGINGFDKHRPVYFISVAPTNKKDNLKISNVYPSAYKLDTMRKGAFTYHDWDSLILTEVPESLVGGVLFTTVRGRAREAHLTGAFRETTIPSTERPDQLLLTWSGDPKTTLDLQWRTNMSVTDGLVKYWKSGSSDTTIAKASAFKMEDRLLKNDRYVQRFTANLTNLSPGSLYQYKVGSEKGKWSQPANFKTESAQKDGFSFVWFGDTHFSEIWGTMAQKVRIAKPDK